MTDSEMKRFLDNLLRDEHDFDDAEIAIALLAAVKMANKYEIDKARAVASER